MFWVSDACRLFTENVRSLSTKAHSSSSAKLLGAFHKPEKIFVVKIITESEKNSACTRTWFLKVIDRGKMHIDTLDPASIEY